MQEYPREFRQLVTSKDINAIDQLIQNDNITIRLWAKVAKGDVIRILSNDPTELKGAYDLYQQVIEATKGNNNPTFCLLNQWAQFGRARIISFRKGPIRVIQGEEGTKRNAALILEKVAAETHDNYLKNRCLIGRASILLTGGASIAPDYAIAIPILEQLKNGNNVDEKTKIEATQYLQNIEQAERAKRHNNAAVNAYLARQVAKPAAAPAMHSAVAVSPVAARAEQAPFSPVAMVSTSTPSPAPAAAGAVAQPGAPVLTHSAGAKAIMAKFPANPYNTTAKSAPKGSSTETAKKAKKEGDDHKAPAVKQPSPPAQRVVTNQVQTTAVTPSPLSAAAIQSQLVQNHPIFAVPANKPAAAPAQRDQEMTDAAVNALLGLGGPQG